MLTVSYLLILYFVHYKNTYSTFCSYAIACGEGRGFRIEVMGLRSDRSKVVFTLNDLFDLDSTAVRLLDKDH